MSLLQDNEPELTRPHHPSASILKVRSNQVAVQSSYPNVRPLSLSFQCGNSKYRMIFHETADQIENHSAFPYTQVHRYVKCKKRVRFLDPPGPENHREGSNVAKSHNKARPEPLAKDTVIQAARANQGALNGKQQTRQSGYHDWVRTRDVEAAHYQWDPNRRSPPTRYADKLRLSTNASSVKVESHQTPKLGSRNHGRLSSPRLTPMRNYCDGNSGNHWGSLSPRPTPIRYYPKNQAIQSTGQPLSPFDIANLEPSSHTPARSAYLPTFQLSKLSRKRRMRGDRSASIGLEAPISRRKMRKRLTKSQIS